MDVQEIACDGVDCIQLDLVNKASGFHKRWESP
jgi:hypothetical protein